MFVADSRFEHLSAATYFSRIVSHRQKIIDSLGESQRKSVVQNVDCGDLDPTVWKLDIRIHCGYTRVRGGTRLRLRHSNDMVWEFARRIDTYLFQRHSEILNPTLRQKPRSSY